MKLIILDRDGVINQDSPDYIKSPEEWTPLPNSLEAIARLTQAGFTVAVATNQSGVGRGLYTEAILEQIHNKMNTLVEQQGGKIAAIFYCPHTPDDNCDCRKPKVGLFNQASSFFNLNFNDAPAIAIGDSLRDLQAAQKAKCQPVLVLTGNGEKTKANLTPELLNTPIFASLVEATEALLSGKLT